MKSLYWIGYALSVCLCTAGILLKNRLNILDIVFVISGIALLLFTFAMHSIRKAQRCPNCNSLIYKGHIRSFTRQQSDGVVPCENCGILVRVNHLKHR